MEIITSVVWAEHLHLYRNFVSSMRACNYFRKTYFHNTYSWTSICLNYPPTWVWYRFLYFKNVLYIILKKLIIIFLTFNHVNLFLVTYLAGFLFSRKNVGEMTNYHKCGNYFRRGSKIHKQNGCPVLFKRTSGDCVNFQTNTVIWQLFSYPIQSFDTWSNKNRINHHKFKNDS